MSSIKKNYFYNLAYQILLIVIPLITTPYVSRVLGPEKVGIYSFTLSITTYFVLFGTLGVALYGQREVAKLQENKTKRSKVFWQLNIIKWITMGISMLIFGLTCMTNGDYGWYYTIFLLELLAYALDIAWYFQGLERFRSATIWSAIAKILGMLAIFLFVKSPDDLWIYILIYCLGNLLSNLVLWTLVPKTLEKGKIALTGIKQHFGPIFLLFIPQVTIQIYTIFDRTMLGVLTDDMSAVGVYEQSQKIVKTALTVVTALGAVMCSRVASLYAQKKTTEIKRAILKSFHFVWVLALPVMFGLMAVASNVVPWFLGDEFLGATGLIQVGSVVVLLIGMSNVIGMQYLVAVGKQKEFMISVVSGAVVNFVGNLILIPVYSAMGAIVASVIAELVVTVSQLVMIRKKFTLRDVFKKAPKCMIAGAAMFVVAALISKMLEPSIVNSVLVIGLGAVVYLVILVVMRDDFVKDILKKIARV